jgi:hypothetical protein
MEQPALNELASQWVDAWNGDDPAAVVALLHDDATIADPTAGKVRRAAIPAFAAERIGLGIVEWRALVGADSVAVVMAFTDGREGVDVLVVADGRIVRCMRHR